MKPHSRRFRVVLVLATVFAACTGKYVRPTTTEVVERTPQRLARGEYLVKSVAACGACHTMRPSGKLGEPEPSDAPLAGGNVMHTLEPEITAWVPNITPDTKTGLGRWSDDQIMRAIRDGVDDEGKFLLPLMPFDQFRFMSDEDVRSVVVYLRSLPAYRQARKPVENDVPFLVRMGLRFGAGRHSPTANIQAPPRSDAIQYGAYLLHVATCADCHSLGKRGPRDPDDRWLAGSDVPFSEGGRVWAPNITPDRETGIGRYSLAQVKEAIHTNRRLDGKKMAPPMSDQAMHYAGMTDGDLNALVAYLFTVKPVHNRVPPRQLDAETKARLGGQEQ